MEQKYLLYLLTVLFFLKWYTKQEILEIIMIKDPLMICAKILLILLTRYYNILSIRSTIENINIVDLIDKIL